MNKLLESSSVQDKIAAVVLANRMCGEENVASTNRLQLRQQVLKHLTPKFIVQMIMTTNNPTILQNGLYFLDGCVQSALYGDFLPFYSTLFQHWLLLTINTPERDHLSSLLLLLSSFLHDTDTISAQLQKINSLPALLQASQPHLAIEIYFQFLTSLFSNPSTHLTTLPINYPVIRSWIVACLHGAAPEFIRDHSLHCLYELMNTLTTTSDHTSNQAEMTITIRNNLFFSMQSTASLSAGSIDDSSFYLLVIASLAQELQLSLEEYLAYYTTSTSTTSTTVSTSPVARFDRLLKMIPQTTYLLQTLLVDILPTIDLLPQQPSSTSSNSNLLQSTSTTMMTLYMSATSIQSLHSHFQSIVQHILDFLQELIHHNKAAIVAESMSIIHGQQLGSILSCLIDYLDHLILEDVAIQRLILAQVKSWWQLLVVMVADQSSHQDEGKDNVMQGGVGGKIIQLLYHTLQSVLLAEHGDDHDEEGEEDDNNNEHVSYVWEMLTENTAAIVQYIIVLYNKHHHTIATPAERGEGQQQRQQQQQQQKGEIVVVDDDDSSSLLLLLYSALSIIYHLLCYHQSSLLLLGKGEENLMVAIQEILLLKDQGHGKGKDKGKMDEKDKLWLDFVAVIKQIVSSNSSNSSGAHNKIARKIDMLIRKMEKAIQQHHTGEARMIDDNDTENDCNDNSDSADHESEEV